MEGDLGRNTYDQPGLSNVDFTLTRNFTTPWFFNEALHLQFQAEVYNLFNRVNLTDVQGDLSQSLFGHATNQLPARSLQLHFRVVFLVSEPSAKRLEYAAAEINAIADKEQRFGNTPPLLRIEVVFSPRSEKDQFPHSPACR
jgi:hypothetical protein